MVNKYVYTYIRIKTKEKGVKKMKENSPYILKSNYFAIKGVVEKVEDLQESKNGILYLVFWVKKTDTYKDDIKEDHFKFVIYQDKASNYRGLISNNDVVTVTGTLKGINKEVDGKLFNNIELKVKDIEIHERR